MCADFETDSVEFNGEIKHAYLLVNSLQGVSPRRLRQEFPGLVCHYYRANKLWLGSYLAGSIVGAPLSVAKQYIEQQIRPVQGAAQAWQPSQRGPSPPA